MNHVRSIGVYLSVHLSSWVGLQSHLTRPLQSHPGEKLIRPEAS